jgi:uncharacterized protein (TIGR02246 family)
VDQVTLSVEDQLAIGQLYARQSHAIDAGDGPRWAACFAEDGRFTSPTYGAPVTGASALAAFVEAFAAAAKRDGVVRRHWTTALELEPDGEDQVAGRCYAMVLATPFGGSPRIERAVVFDDRLVRRDERWVIERRRVTVDGTA